MCATVELVKVNADVLVPTAVKPFTQLDQVLPLHALLEKDQVLCKRAKRHMLKIVLEHTKACITGQQKQHTAKCAQGLIYT